jgi:ABC-type multidrug transport system fused ATPase/permease subunit
MKSFLYVVKGREGTYAALLAAALILSGTMVVLNPLFLKFAFEECLIRGEFGRFALSLGGFVALATAFRFLTLLCALRVQRLKNDAAKALSARMVDAFYRTPYRRILEEGAGYHSSRMVDEPQWAAATTIELSMDLAMAAFSFALAAAVLGSLSLPATAALAATVPPLHWLASRYGRDIRKHSTQEKEGEGRLRAVATRAAESYRTVNGFELNALVRGKLGEAFDAHASSVQARLTATGLQTTMSTVLMSHGELLVTLVCGYEMARGRMSFGGYMAFMTAFWSAASQLRTLINRLPETARVGAALDRLQAFEDAAEGVPVAAASEVRLRGVEFGFGGAPVLSGVSLSLRRGEKLLLLGKNGAGKSTLANVLAGFLAPVAGDALVPGVARTSACVSPFHFAPGSLAENLSGGSRAYRTALVEEFGLAESLDKLPSELSAGQRKKAEVIMGLLKDAELYVFDEPLANVDTGAKRAIMRRIVERAQGKGLVVIMHGDEELASGFDRVVELGKPAKLMEETK